jgi:N-acetylmuramoyl-L-alanine amidase/Bacterial Ig domain
MGSRRRQIAFGAAALAAAVAVPAAGAAGLRPPAVDYVGPGTPLNYTPAQRKPSDIHLIVIHVSEGSFFGTVRWLQNPQAHASANFVVSRNGTIAELVPKSDIAWHSGNWDVNTESVGIEHEGITDDPSGFTDAQYRASAHLTAYIARTSLIPIDREHIIGHYQVPNPNDPAQGGGIDGHTDPGSYWNWPHYMKLVRSFAFPRKPHVGLDVLSSTVYPGQILAGTVPWRAHVKGPVTRVDFLVDGHLRRSDGHRPFTFGGGLATRKLGNGTHRLELRAYSHRGHWTRDRFVVHVRNLPFLVHAVGVAPHGSVDGVVKVQARIVGESARTVGLYLDGKQIDHDTSFPYVFTWDTRLVVDGAHVLVLRAHARDGRDEVVQVPVLVANPGVVTQSILDGQTVSAPVVWSVQTIGPVKRVEFLVDGTVVGTASSAPWSITWDPSPFAPGMHVLTARAQTPTRSVDSTLNVVVSR